MDFLFNKLNNEALEYISLFEMTTRVQPIDVIIKNGYIAFIVDKRDASMAYGLKGRNLELLRSKLEKNIYIFQYCRDIRIFIQEFFHKTKISSIKLAETKDNRRILTITISDKEDRNYAIGKDGYKAKLFRELLKRYGFAEFWH
jgi:NusA-like KH domain protein